MGALGGFYINALNNQQRARFIAAHQIKAAVSVTLELRQQAALTFNRSFIVGESFSCTESVASIRIVSELTDAGLLHLECYIVTPDKTLQQAFYLTPNETLTSLVEGDDAIKLTVCAHQQESSQ